MSKRSPELKRKLMHEALVGYATLLADHYGLEITAQDFDQVNRLADQHCGFFGSQKERRESFEAIATFVLHRFGLKREPLVVAQYRNIALTDAGLDISGQVMPVVASDDVSSVASSEERFLDTEFVAIYW